MAPRGGSSGASFIGCPVGNSQCAVVKSAIQASTNRESASKEKKIKWMPLYFEEEEETVPTQTATTNDEAR